jgi:CRISPR/Cas system-associated exonuclease Cas4 (RecB family)
MPAPPPVVISDPPKTIKAWSYSSLKSYEGCPLRIQFGKIDRIPRNEPPPDSPMLRGSRIHEEIEQYILNGTEIPTRLKYNGDRIEESRQNYLLGMAQTELAWAFDTNWKLVPNDDPTLWLRAVLDVFIQTEPTTATIVDWKSGKSWLKDVPHLQQAQLYAACAFQVFPELEVVKTVFAYVDEKGKETVRNYTRQQAEVIEVSYHNRGLRMTTATHFPPKPGQLNCKYCDYGSQFGNSHCVYDVFRDDCIRPATGHLRQRTIR